MKGYRLHDERIAYSGGTKSMRSIKYELVDTADTPGLRNKLADAIAGDYRVLYGPINFDEYLKQDGVPSLVDFWLKALSLGFVFSSQNNIESEFLNYLGKKTVWQTCYENLSDELRMVIDEKSFCDFLIKQRHRGVDKKTDTQRQRIILNLLKSGVDEKSLLPIAGAWSRDYSLEKEELAFKCKIFGIRKPDIPSRDLSLGFAIDPSFSVLEIKDKTELLDFVIAYYEKRVGAVQAKKFLAIGDNGNYFNSMLSRLLPMLKGSGIRTIADSLNKTYGLDSEAVLLERLESLRILAVRFDEPRLVRQWSDYRIDFNGTIESWFTNRAAKQQIVREQLDGVADKKTGDIVGGLKVLLEDVRHALPDGNGIKEGILADAIQFVGQNRKRIDRKFTVELDSYLVTLKTDLNEWSQHNKKNSLPHNWQANLSKRVQSSPLFFGENKYALWDQLIQLKQLICAETEKLGAILAAKFEDYEITDKQIDMLAQLYNRIKDDGNKKVIRQLSIIQDSLGVDFSARTERMRFYVSGYERTKVTKLAVAKTISVQGLRKLANLGEFYEIVKNSPQDSYILRDVTQLSKIVLAALVYGSGKEREVVLIHSNLSGYASLISRREFISRATVQAANGAQLVLGLRGEKYCYGFLPEKFPHRAEARLFAKTCNFSKTDLGAKVAMAPILAVRSSKYQVQFLDWFMGLHSRKKTSLSAGGAFSIAEKTVQLDWTGESPKIVAVSDPRVFVSQPFEIKPKDVQGHAINQDRFIGVDIGEYGLAWSLVDIKNDIVTRIEDGFISDKQQHKLKISVKKLRESHVRATFTSPDTRVARIRESLIGSYRNTLESLAMRKNARLSFEYEVSAFEAGGNRISKVYDSIKRGDIRKRDNKSANRMAWGEGGAENWGYETSAAGTSQTCSKCMRWSSLAVDVTANYKLDEYQDGLFKTRLSDGEVRLLKNTTTGDSVKGNELKGLIYKAMRPNADGLGMEIVKRVLDWSVLGKDYGAAKARGNIAIFVCPYVNCHHIADADKQAALNIAIRGYVKSRNAKITKASQYTEQQQTLVYEPVGLKASTGENRGLSSNR